MSVKPRKSKVPARSRSALLLRFGRSAEAGDPRLVRVSSRANFRSRSRRSSRNWIASLSCCKPTTRRRHSARRRRRRRAGRVRHCCTPGRGRNAGRRSRAAARSSLLAAYPVRAPTTSRLRGRLRPPLLEPPGILFSPIRCSINFTRHPWSIVSSNPRISASSTQFTFLHPIPIPSASSA